jgi:oligopeptide transport system substrate-binding protein
MKPRIAFLLAALSIATLVGAALGTAGTAKQAASSSTLRIAQSGLPDPLDPTLLVDNRSIEIAQNVWDGLVDVTDQMTLVPALAQSWKVSGNGTVYTFNLRRNARFSNGQPITAQDVVFTYNRTLDPKIASPTSFYLADIQGADAVLKGKAKAATGIRAIGKHTVRIKLSHPAGYFLSLVSRWPAWIVSQAAVTAGGKDWIKPQNSVGSGAYHLVNQIGDSQFDFDASQYYYRGKPRIQHVTVLSIPDSTAALARYQAGDVDAVINLSTASVLKAQSDPKLKAEFHSRPLLRTVWLGMQVNKPPFTDRRVRLAFGAAIDKKTLVKIALSNQATAAGGWLPPGLPGAVKRGDSFNPKLAKQLLAQAGFANGSNFPHVDLTYTLATGEYKEVFEFIQGQLQQNLGIKVGLKEMPTAAFQSTMKDAGKRPLLWAYSFGLDYPDAQEMDSYLAFTGQSYNFENWSNKAFEAIVNKANAIPNQQQRASLYRRAETIRLNDAPVIPLYYPNTNWIVKPYVKGFNESPLYMSKWFQMSVAQH